MTHGHGLGVLAVGKAYPQALNVLLGMRENEIVNFRELFYQLGRQLEVHLEKEQVVQTFSAQLAEKEQAAQVLSAQVNEEEQEVQSLATQLNEKEQALRVFENSVHEKEQIIQVLKAQAQNDKETLYTLQKKMDETEQELQSLNAGNTILSPAIEPSAESVPASDSSKTDEGDALRQPSVLLAPSNSRRDRVLQRLIDVAFSALKKTRISRKLKGDLTLVRSSGLFDEDWYRANNPDVAQAKVDPLLHYLRYGGFEGRDPGPNFCSAWYLATYEDVKKVGVNPLVHYIKYGREEGRAAQPDQALTAQVEESVL